METELKGIKEVKEAIDFGIAITHACIAIAADKKVDFQDAAQIVALMPAVGPGLDGIGEIPAELADLSAPEAAEIVAHVAAKLTIDNEKAKVVAVAAVKAALANYELFKAIKGLKAA